MNEIGRKIVDKLIELHGSKDFKIAFLPYKRSMWNSMSSVYEECIKSGIDARVFPIPYKRMDDGSTDTDFVYFDEGEPLQDLKAPDYIVIQYYFDDCNRVTNMLPEFYTSALKAKYKCKIVFIPYGIKFDDRPTDLYPGFKDVDYIFSGDTDDEFIETWKKAGIDFTGRVFNYGSPKLDVARRMRGVRIIPEIWLDKVKDRQVTLMVNSLVPFLNEPYKHILDYLYTALQEIGRGRVVIFRPHPLLKTTIKTMCPEVETYYNILLGELKALKVIVDESEYLERAMYAADYLVSDPSSVVYMWLETGKPYWIIGGSNG